MCQWDRNGDCLTINNQGILVSGFFIHRCSAQYHESQQGRSLLKRLRLGDIPAEFLFVQFLKAGKLLVSEVHSRRAYYKPLLSPTKGKRLKV